MLLNDLAIWCMKYVAADLSINVSFSFIFSSCYCCTVQETLRSSTVCYSLRVKSKHIVIPFLNQHF